MPRLSAGLLMYRLGADDAAGLEVLLVHPGGPFWVNKDLGAWTIPKGECLADEELIASAIREFKEETSFAAGPPFVALGEAKQSGSKVIHAWAFQGDCDPAALVSNTCMIEWPPRSKRMLTIPEVDRGAWFALEEARVRILKGQAVFLDRLGAAVK